MTQMQDWEPPSRGAQGWDAPLNAKLQELVDGVNERPTLADAEAALDATIDATIALAIDEASTDYATAAQGAKADTAVQPAELESKADLVGGVVPSSQIPGVALTTGQAVADTASMLALADVQPGDIVSITGGADKGTYLLGSGDSTVFASWLPLSAPTDVVTSVNGQQGTVVLGAADVNAVPTSRTVAGKPLSANVTLAKADVGLASVDDTSDADKPVSTAQAAAIVDAGAFKLDGTVLGVGEAIPAGLPANSLIVRIL